MSSWSTLSVDISMECKSRGLQGLLWVIHWFGMNTVATFNPFTVIRPKRKTWNKGEKKKKGSAQMVRIARLLQALSNSLAGNLHSFVRQLVILPSACQETHNRFIVPVNKSFRSSQTYYRLMQRERASRPSSPLGLITRTTGFQTPMRSPELGRFVETRIYSCQIHFWGLNHISRWAMNTADSQAWLPFCCTNSTSFYTPPVFQWNSAYAF